MLTAAVTNWTPTETPSPPAEDADRALARSASTGDVAAFEALYRRHCGRVHGVITRLVGGHGARAEDLTQEAFVRAWQALPAYRFESAFSTWLHRLAVNVVIERFRTETTRRQRYHDGEELFDVLPAAARSGDFTMDFEASLAKLPDGAREIFVLHDVEGYKHQEIADMLEISAGTSKAQLHRARMMLRRHLAGGA